MKRLFFNKRIPGTQPSRWKKFRIRVVVFLVFFLITEIVLRLIGFKPGVAQDYYYQSGEVVYDSILYADEAGITHLVSTARFSTDQVMNKEGFHSSVEFTPEAMDSLRAKGKKIILLVGDSFTQGSAATSYKRCFAYRLNKSDDYEVLNFGIGGTDPLHYELVVKKYAAMLKPDLIAVAVYLGNDEMVYDRTAKPYIPVCYPVKGGHWLSSEAYVNLRKPNTYFRNFDEAKDFFYSYYSLNGDNARWYERVIRQSVILSRLYLYLKIKRTENNMVYDKELLPEKPPFTYNHLKAIQDFGDSAAIPVVFGVIPSVPDLSEKKNIRSKYKHLFEELNWHCITTVNREDYDGSSLAAHFNDAGHKKFARFLKKLIDQKLKKK